MSAPLKLTSGDLGRLARALSGLSDVTKATQVRFDGYSQVEARVTDDVVLSVSWDAEADQYVVDDRSGS